MTNTSDEELIGRLIRETAARLPVTDIPPAGLPALTGSRSGWLRRTGIRRPSLAVVVSIGVVAAVLGIVVSSGLRRPSDRLAHGTVPSSSAAFPILRPGEACPATAGRAVSNRYFAGVELGRGEVRMLIANAGDLRRGVVDISPADHNNPLGPSRFYAFQDFWYSLPTYKRTWTVTAKRLDGRGQVRFGNSDPTSTASPVPAGGDQAFGPGFRSGIGSTWVSNPGCYGFKVTGPGLHELIILRVALT
ncbi:MAG: hypothetical protein ACRDL5_15285 [Solirubrobacteraceae bacterium]